MSPTITPAGGVAELERPASTADLRYRYAVSRARGTFSVPVPIPPPADALVDVEVRVEDGVIVMNAIGIDVAVEAAEPAEAFAELVDAVRAWLEFLRDEQPKLAPELEEQRRYVALLGHDAGTWFRRLYLG